MPLRPEKREKEKNSRATEVNNTLNKKDHRRKMSMKIYTSTDIDGA
jgi:hypothetical protein